MLWSYRVGQRRCEEGHYCLPTFESTVDRSPKVNARAIPRNPVALEGNVIS